jgi:hypothetical protein
MATSTHHLKARQDAERARLQAFWNQLLHNLRGIPNDLLPFSAVRDLNPTSERYGGIRAIPLSQIVGSVDRYRDFDHYFLPRLDHSLDRWASVRRAGLEGIELPPIQVYQVGDVYFVKDGHHRVSVARRTGQQFIDAEVIELQVTVPPDATDSLKDLIIKGEYARFLEATGLGRLRPDHEPILFTVPGRYDILLDHIQTRHYYLGLERQGDVPWSEAVTTWYDDLYVPIIKELREHRILERFPGRTEADLYLWIMDHRYYLAQRYGQQVDFEAATLDYAQHYAPDLLRRLWQRALQRWRGQPTP